jgi:hypothetical protein
VPTLPSPSGDPSRVVTPPSAQDNIVTLRPSAAELVDSDQEETKPLLRVCTDSLERLDACADSVGLVRTATSSWQVAAGCAVALAKTLDARNVLVHHHDASRRELRLIGLHGPNAEDLLGSVASVDNDLIATFVLSNREPMTMCFEGRPPRFAPRRFEGLGASRSVVAVPVSGVGGCVAILEIVDVAPGLEHLVHDACDLAGEELRRVLSPHA